MSLEMERGCFPPSQRWHAARSRCSRVSDKRWMSDSEPADHPRSPKHMLLLLIVRLRLPSCCSLAQFNDWVAHVATGISSHSKLRRPTWDTITRVLAAQLPNDTVVLVT